ncbi:surface protein [Xylariales sp. PMI_506]|nr:surface protein [Xylariales sp. PMI_506]
MNPFRTALFLFLSAPILAVPLSMTAADFAKWTMVGLSRTCLADGTMCTWRFSVNTNEPNATATPCTLFTRAGATVPASQGGGGPTLCGNFTVSSGWSGQFGPGNGFTTIALIDFARKLMAYPSYADNDLPDGQVVAPDRTYAVSPIP